MNPLRQKMNRKRRAHKWGAIAEHIAALLLMVKGYRLVARNYRRRAGEIDIIACRHKLLVFVEVKFRADPSTISYAIAPTQWRRIEAAAMRFVAEHPVYHSYTWRFDSVLLAPFPRHRKDIYRNFD